MHAGEEDHRAAISCDDGVTTARANASGNGFGTFDVTTVHHYRRTFGGQHSAIALPSPALEPVTSARLPDKPMSMSIS